jgi:hypothetical protein
MVQAARARCAMTPPRDPATLTGAARRSGASFSAVARAARTRSRRAVLAAPSGSDGCPLRSLSLVAGSLHCKRATAQADAPRALVTPAGCARRRQDRGATPEFWVKGLPPKNGARWQRSKKQTPCRKRGSGRRRITMSERKLVETLRELGRKRSLTGQNCALVATASRRA